jgi:hypothetical protein
VVRGVEPGGRHGGKDSWKPDAGSRTPEVAGDATAMEDVR